MKFPKISMIVPVYNAEKFLEKCIDSILKQTLSDWELILIDDGSKDKSAEICDRYSSIDNRIKVVHKINEGVSIARNTGISLARGEFIGFIDSDDNVKENFFEVMYETAKEQNSEIVMCDALTVYKSGKTELDTIKQLSNSLSVAKSDWSPALLLEMAGAAWRCFYKKELIDKHNISFPSGIKFSEDRIFNIYSFGFAENIYYLKEPFYNRLIWEESAVHRFHSDYFAAAKASDQATVSALNGAWNGDIEYINCYKQHLIAAALASINNYFYKTSTLSFKEKYSTVKTLCNDSQLRDALKVINSKDIRIFLIKAKLVLPLCAISFLLNKIHNR